MRKKWLILAGCFFGGILLCGLGVGIGFVEFSGFRYAGERQLGTIVEDTLVYDEKEDVDTYYLYAYQSKDADKTVVSDNDLPEGRIEIDLKYNDDFEHPYLETDTYIEEQTDTYEDQEKTCEIFICYPADDMKLLMKYKDIFLADMKAGQIGSYGSGGTGSYDITVRCHPSMVDKIEIVY